MDTTYHGFGLRFVLNYFCVKVFEILKNFFQKVLKWGAGLAPQNASRKNHYLVFLPLLFFGAWRCVFLFLPCGCFFGGFGVLVCSGRTRHSGP